MKSGRTNDEVRDAPGGRLDRPGELGRARPPTSSPPSTTSRPTGHWTLGGHELHLTNLDKALFPPRGRRRRPITKRDLIRHYATIGAGDAAVPGRPGGQHAPLPRRRRQHRVLAQGGADPRTGVDPPVAQPGRRPRRDPGPTSSPTRPPTLAWLANFGALELHPWTSTVDAPARADVGVVRHRSRRDDDFDDVLELARLHRTALEHLGVDGCPKVTGKRGIQIWVPVARGYTFTETRSWVETVSRAIGATVPGAGQLGMGGRPPRRPDPARLHPERHQQDPRRPVQHPPRARARPCRCRSPGTSSTTTASAPTAGPSTTSTDGSTSRRPARPAHRPPTTPPTALTRDTAFEVCAAR